MLKLLSRVCEVRHGNDDWDDRLLCRGSAYIERCPKKRRRWIFDWGCIRDPRDL